MGVRPRIDVISSATEPKVRELLLEKLGKNQLLVPEDSYSVLNLRPDLDTEERWQMWTSRLSDEVLVSLLGLFLFLCERTDWELLLDWDDASYIPAGYQYRPRGQGGPFALDLDDPDSPLWTL